MAISSKLDQINISSTNYEEVMKAFEECTPGILYETHHLQNPVIDEDHVTHIFSSGILYETHHLQNPVIYEDHVTHIFSSSKDGRQ